MDQEDTYPPLRNGIGDACDCEGNFDCNEGVDAGDVDYFLLEWNHRHIYRDPCTDEDPCIADFNCSGGVDAGDVGKFLEDWNQRNIYDNPCPECVVGDWCNYSGPTTTTTTILCIEEGEVCDANSQCCNGCCCPATYFPDPVCWPIALCVELDPYVPCLQ